MKSPLTLSADRDLRRAGSLPGNAGRQAGKPLVRIALIVDTSRAFGRAVCRGAARFVRDREPWQLFPLETEMDAGRTQEWLAANRISGIIAGVQSRDFFRCLKGSGLPLVNVSLRDAAPEITSVTVDSAAVAGMAAEFFLDAGVRNFAFCGYPGLRFSAQRGKAFEAACKGYGCMVSSPAGRLPAFGGYAGYEHGLDAESPSGLGEWLRGLPKPVGVLACNDIRGQQVIRAAREYGIGIPDEMMVLGVDNDEILCTLSSPALSSIDPNGEEIGHVAALELDRLLQGSASPGLQLAVPPAQLVSRHSTINTEHPLIPAALRIIRERSDDNELCPVSLCAELGCSRIKLDRLFKKHLGRTPFDEITRLRVKHITEMLLGTPRPIGAIAQKFGFTSSVTFSQFNRRETGLSPRALRHKNREAFFSGQMVGEPATAQAV
jgi:LacI family transcriptional regulator